MFEVLLFIALLLGQLGRVQVTPTIAFYLHDIIIFLYIVFNIPALVKRKKEIGTLSLIRPMMIVSGVCLLSLVVNLYRFYADELVVGLAYFLRFCMYFVLYVIVRLGKKPMRFWLYWLFTLSVGFAILGMLQLFLYPDLRNLSYAGWDPHYYRLFSTLLDPNYMGIILLLAFVLGVSLVKNGKKQILPIAGLILILSSFLLTYSRSSFVAGLGALVTYILCIKKWKKLLWVFVFCIVLYTLPVIGGESSLLFRTTTALARISNWQEGIGYFFESPIIGYGFNMVGALFHNAPTLDPTAAARSVSGYDNSVVFILVTTGLVGLSAFVFLWSKMVAVGCAIVKNTKHKYVGIVYVTSLCAIFIHSMFVNTLFYPQVMILVWILTGAVEKEKNTPV